MITVFDTAGPHHLAVFLIVVATLLLVVVLADRSPRRPGVPVTERP